MVTPLDFPSLEWTAAYKDAINANENYKKSGKDWTHGIVGMVVKAEPSLKIDEDLAMLLDVHAGECRSCKLVTGKEVEIAPFVVTASYAQWKQVIKREIDPTKALMQGKLKLTKGHMPTMVKYVHASKDLVESTAKVPTKFRDE
jgi:putative sterol carrier protein